MHEFAYLFLLRANPSLGTLRCRWRFCSRVQVLRKLPSLTIHSETSASHTPKPREWDCWNWRSFREGSSSVPTGAPFDSLHTPLTQSDQVSLSSFPIAESQMSSSIYSQHSNIETARAGMSEEDPQQTSLHLSSSPLLSKRSPVTGCWSVSQCPLTSTGCHPSSWPLLSQRLSVLLSGAPTQSSICISICISVCILQAQLPGWEVFLLPGWEVFLDSGNQGHQPQHPGRCLILGWLHCQPTMDVTSRAPLPPWIPCNHRKESGLDLSLGIPLHTLACAAMNL